MSSFLSSTRIFVAKLCGPVTFVATGVGLATIYFCLVEPRVDALDHDPEFAPNVELAPPALVFDSKAPLLVQLGARPVQSSGLSLLGFSETFLRDYASARKLVDQTKSAQPLIELQRRYTSVTEQAELDLALGLIYGQRTGLTDPSKTITHFTRALQYELPERIYISIMMWRGNAQEHLNRPGEALMDYLRDLLACARYDLTGGWKKIQTSNVPILADSPVAENTQRTQDYRLYRKHLDFEQFLLQQRWSLIDNVKRARGNKSDREVFEMLQTLTPDSIKCRTVMDWLKSENKRPGQ